MNKELLNTLVEKIRETDRFEIYGYEAYFYVGEFEIQVNGAHVSIKVDDKIIYKESSNTIPLFLDFTFYGKVFRESERRKIENKKKREMEEQMEKIKEQEEKDEYINRQMNTWLNQLNGIKTERTGIFDEVSKDYKRLLDITKEANTIRSKYQKEFMNN